MGYKYADGRKIPGLQKSIYKQMIVDDYEFQGYVCYLNYDRKDERTGKIINYTQLQFYSTKRKYVLIAGFKPDDTFNDFYVDISRGVGIGEDGIPYQDDLYIDVRVYSNGVAEIVDEDEFKEALDKGLVTEEEYKKGYRLARKIAKILPRYFDRVRRYVNNYYIELKSR